MKMNIDDITMIETANNGLAFIEDGKLTAYEDPDGLMTVYGIGKDINDLDEVIKSAILTGRRTRMIWTR